MGSRNESEEVGSNMLIVPDDYMDGSNEQGDLEYANESQQKVVTEQWTIFC